MVVQFEAPLAQLSLAENHFLFSLPLIDLKKDSASIRAFVTMSLSRLSEVVLAELSEFRKRCIQRTTWSPGASWPLIRVSTRQCSIIIPVPESTL
mmetsp:Transcript_25487/g.47501  ORF Transcript_25487/g.47501 Transcript_25487/m.47501 type:complete len:95 (-) Transcript_25487:171-455(-)